MQYQSEPKSVPTGAVLRALRTGADLSLRSMAERVGVSFQHLARVETGERIATQDLADRIAVAVGHTMSGAVK